MHRFLPQTRNWGKSLMQSAFCGASINIFAIYQRPYTALHDILVYQYSRLHYNRFIIFIYCIILHLYAYVSIYISVPNTLIHPIHHILHTFSLYQRPIFIYCVILHLYAYVSIYISVPNALIQPIHHALHIFSNRLTGKTTLGRKVLVHAL